MSVQQDWLEMTDAELAAYAEAENRRRSSPEAREILGDPEPGVAISWESVRLPDREIAVRVYRPESADGPLPLVQHVHGGGFVGTAVQSDWVNSHLAAHLPAVVVSVEHRLLAAGTPLSDAVADGRDVLAQVVADAARWGVDPERVAVFGESCGGLISALAAIHARGSGPRLRAQVLVNPAVDASESMFDYDSMAAFPQTPTLGLPVLRLFRRLGVPEGADAKAVSPLHAGDLGGLAPALVVVPTDDPLADQGRRYAAALGEAGTPARLSEYAGAGHAFLSVPGLMPQAVPARAEVLAFLREALAG